MKSLHYIIKSRRGKYDEQPGFRAVKLCKQCLELWQQVISLPQRRILVGRGKQPAGAENGMVY